jgi:alpha,alpha-trehalase
VKGSELHSLWSRWPGIRQTLSCAFPILLFDFDGTLAPIAADPARARLPEATRKVLARLSRLPCAAIGVVSGRQLAELQRLVRLKNICYIGSHGMEYMLPGGSHHLRATPAQCRRIQHIATQLSLALRGLPGILVERKIASVAVHYRNAEPQHIRRALAEVQRIRKRNVPRLRLLEGKNVVELLPADSSDKGAAVKTLVARLRPRDRKAVVVYLGDDATDESVFGCLGKNDVTVLVGRPRKTRARFYLRSPAQVCNFLRRVCKILR